MAAHTHLVLTTEMLIAQIHQDIGDPITHRLSREELAAWNAEDEEVREEARRAIREGAREAGIGALVDDRERVIEELGSKPKARSLSGARQR
jgi:hypothetical protein